MQIHQTACILAGAVLCAWAGFAQAQGPRDFGLAAIRGGVMAHSVDEPHAPHAVFGALNLSRIEDANVELVFRPPDWSAWSWLGSPRLALGATVNFGGLESMAYGELLWHADLFGGPVFIEGGLGGAVADGVLHGATPPGRSLGCPFLFHEQVSLGYTFDNRVEAMLTAEHASNAGLCTDNRGLTNLGIRLGYRF